MPKPKKKAARKAAPKKPAARTPRKPARKAKPTAAKAAPSRKSPAPSPKPRAAPKSNAPDVSGLVALLGAPAADVRESALEKLRALGPGSRAAVGEAARSLAGLPLKHRAATAIGLARLDREHLPAALPVLAELVAVGASGERGLIREVLALMPVLGLHALPLLPALLLRLENAPREEVQPLLEAVRAAGPLGAEAVHKAAMESAGPFGARLVALLDAYDRPEHVAWLGELSRHADMQVRLAAVGALARRRSRESFPHLLRALRDPSTEVVESAQAVLKQIPGTILEPVLAAFLLHLRQDPPEARNAAVVAASELGVASFDDIGPLLLDALSDAAAAIRAGGAKGLEALAPTARAALPRLRAQRKDSSPEVRAAVEAAIGAIERAPK